MEDLLPEITLKIFYYIPFCLSLRTVALVSKKWLDLLKITKNSKLMTVDLRNTNYSFYQYKIIAAKYNIEQLVISHLGDSLFPLAALINASPALNTLAIGRSTNGGLFENIMCQGRAIPKIFLVLEQMRSKLSFSKIRRLEIPSHLLSILHIFPNVRQLKFDMLESLFSEDDDTCQNQNLGPFESVKEIDTRVYEYEEVDFKHLKTIFPNLETLHLSTNDSEEIENKCKGIVTVHCKNISLFPRTLHQQFSERSYAEYFFRNGETPFVSLFKSRGPSASDVEEFLQRHSFLTAEYESDFSARDREVVFPSESELYDVTQVTPPLLQNLPAEIQAVLHKHNIIPPALLKERPKPANDLMKLGTIQPPTEEFNPILQWHAKISNNNNPPTDQDDEAEKFWKKLAALSNSLVIRDILDHVSELKNWPIRNYSDLQIFAKFLYPMSMVEPLFEEVYSVIGKETLAKLINTRMSGVTVIHYFVVRGLNVEWDLIADLVDWSVEDDYGRNAATLAFLVGEHGLCQKFLQFGVKLQIEHMLSSSYLQYYKCGYDTMDSEAVVSDADLKRWVFSYTIKEKNSEKINKSIDYIINRLKLTEQDILTIMNRHVTAAGQLALVLHLKHHHELDLNKRDNNNETTLQVAINSKNFSAVNFALTYGADPNLEIADGMSPLVYLCNTPFNSDQDMIFFHLTMDALVALGADIHRVHHTQHGEKLNLIEVAQRAGNPIDSIVHYINKSMKK